MNSGSRRPGRARVLVLGGGIAGIAAALELGARGVAVTLVESRERLGGRASSFFDAKSGLWLDNCQHVALGCCEEYLRLCEMLDAARFVRWFDEQYWVEPGGRTSVLRPSVLPAPLHGLPSFLRASFLTASEKARVAAAFAQIPFLNQAERADQTFAQLLDHLEQGEGERRKFWDPIIISACNLDPSRVSAAPAIQVFQDGLLAGARASRIGLMTVPLGKVYEPAETRITEAGGSVLFGDAITWFDARSARLASSRVLEADAVVCALPFEKAVLYADDSLKRSDPRFQGLARMSHSPILGVHLFFDRSVLPVPHAVLVGCSTQWLFRKDDAGRVVHAVISAADDWMGLDQEEIVDRVIKDLVACFPGASGAELKLARPVKERRATFAYVPGFDRWRPEASSEVSPLIFAGDYTQTGWPATMEGAARSGFAAARAVLRAG